MSHHPKKPCAQCPYRLDAERGAWHPEHYQSVLDADRDPLNGAMFSCHEHGSMPPRERGVCAGWLLDQRERGVPNIRLRLALRRDDGIVHALNDVSSDVPMFKSASEMALVNLAAINDGACASPAMEEKVARIRARVSKKKD